MILDDVPVLSVEATRAAEQAVFDAGVDAYALMCTAGEGAAEMIWRAGHKRPVLVLCGPGNNGGDGYVIARALREKGVAVRVAASAEPRTESSKRARADWGGPVEDIMTAEPAVQVVDALFGIGLTRGLDAPLAERLCALTDAAHHSYAVDMPSGIESDAGTILSPVPRFSLCLALGVLKPAHVLLPAAERFGDIAYVPIGLEAGEAPVRMLGAPRLHVPGRSDHKYTRGLVGIVAGAMPGAAALAAEAALRGGAGYVRLIGAKTVPSLSHAIVPTDDSTLADPRTRAILVGPGLGRGADAANRLKTALAAGHPAVIDADGVLALSSTGFDVLPQAAILTPHGGEFASLFGDLPGNKIDRALAAAQQSGAVVILKGNDTVIAASDGRARIAPPASTWLSTAGTGDVLAGLCAARLAVTGDPFVAACEAVWLHGDAARRADAAFAADDLAAHIPAAIASRL
jgi:hydroxyethylthiazole kinase-like uncharacterized protein yjeF